MNLADVYRLEDSLKTTLGLSSDGDIRAVDAMVKELRHLQTLSPRVFQAAMLMITSMVLACGDHLTETSASDLVAKMERLVALQKEISEAVQKSQEQALSRVLDRLGLDNVDEPLPKEKLN